MLVAFTAFHVLISLAGIIFGLVVLFDWLASKPYGRANAAFLITTIATSVTGFFFPFHGVTPGIVIGIVSLVVLAVACAALYRFQLAGGWRRSYAITAEVALYLNIFVLIAQLFQKVPALKALAPEGTGPAFGAAQLVILVAFVILCMRATQKFMKPASSPEQALGAHA